MGSSSVTGDEVILFSDNMSFDGTARGGKMTTNGQLWIGHTTSDRPNNGGHVKVGSLTSPNSSITFGYSSPNITAVVNTSVVTDFHVARYIVSAGGITDGANYTTIATAYAAAVAAGAPQTVFIQPGTYTENLTLVAGINLCAFPCDSFTFNVTIIGKITATYTGTCSISGIRLQTNGDYCVESTGANVLTLFLIGCYINATNANAIHCTNANAGIELFGCRGACSTNTFFIYTAGALNVFYSVLAGTNTTTNSTFSGGAINVSHSYISCPITTSGTGAIGLFKSELICTNTTALTHGGSGNSIAMETRFESGTASAISIGATLPVIHSSVFSTNANAITGAGTLLYGIIVFYGSGASSTVNTGTQTALATLI